MLFNWWIHAVPLPEMLTKRKMRLLMHVAATLNFQEVKFNFQIHLTNYKRGTFI